MRVKVQDEVVGEGGALINLCKQSFVLGLSDKKKYFVNIPKVRVLEEGQSLIS